VVLQGKVVLPPSLLRVISAPLAGLVEQVHVAHGDALSGPQTLVSLNAPQLIEWQREHQQSSLQATLAQQTADRDNALLAEGIIPGARAQASQNQLRLAQAAYRERAQMLTLVGAKPDATLSGRLALKAPGRGTVLEVLIEPGQRVEAGAPLLKFASQGPLWIELQASAEVAQGLKVGDVVRVQGCAMPARLTTITPQLNAVNQTQTVRAQWPQANDCALPQQRVQAEVAISGAQKQASGQSGLWLVPASAVVKADGQDTVFVQRAGGFAALKVQVMGQQGPLTSLKSTQLSGKDELVTQGAVALKGMAQGLGAP
jgi:cobalt-zinc-cadmium efflux system membrane fusion protein